MIEKNIFSVDVLVEYYLGISCNNRKTPDYKGIELKEKRVSGKTRSGGTRRAFTRYTLFDQVPDWRSRGLDRNELLNRYGWWDADEQRLLEKHPQTFWVDATSIMDGGTESFRYDYVKNTRHPNASLLPTLIDEGIITVDYLLHRYPDMRAARGHGFPFKIKPSDMSLLFLEQRFYDLSKM